LLAGYDRIAPVDTDEGIAGLSGNDVMLAGISQAQCYNATLSYLLGNLPPAQLRMADVLAERDGLLNIRNPACFIFPVENGCQPGDQFRADQLAEAFDSSQPFPFHKSHAQQLADRVTMTGLLATTSDLSAIWPLMAGYRHRLISRQQCPSLRSG